MSSTTAPLTAQSLNNYANLTAQLTAPQDGYVLAYVGNEGDTDVLFDDVEVLLQPGVQVQETQYDPAGLSLAGLARPESAQPVPVQRQGVPG